LKKEDMNVAKPDGITKKTKDNSKKKYRENLEWMRGKKLGRPKQQWVPVLDADGWETSEGHWEKV
jgi:hypothetical protein